MHIGRMTLAEWMADKQVSDETLAAQLKVHRSTISRVRRAQHVPSGELIAALVDVSKGTIDPGTFIRARYSVAGDAA